MRTVGAASVPGGVDCECGDRQAKAFSMKRSFERMLSNEDAVVLLGA
jgi:hypothetical protein